MTRAEQYSEYLKSAHWKSLRAKAKRKKKPRCAICRARRALQLHHLQYRNLFNVTLADLRWLCPSCHMTAHRLMAEGNLSVRGLTSEQRISETRRAVLEWRRAALLMAEVEQLDEDYRRHVGV